MKNITPDSYLDKNFDYEKLTKIELKKILLENNVDFKSSLLKKDLLEVYKKNIHDKIDILKKKKQSELEQMENIYQKDRSSIMELDISDKKIIRKKSAPGKKLDIKDNDDFKVPETKIEDLSGENAKSPGQSSMPKLRKHNLDLEKDETKNNSTNVKSVFQKQTPIRNVTKTQKSPKKQESKSNASPRKQESKSNASPRKQESNKFTSPKKVRETTARTMQSPKNTSSFIYNSSFNKNSPIMNNDFPTRNTAAANASPINNTKETNLERNTTSPRKQAMSKSNNQQRSNSSEVLSSPHITKGSNVPNDVQYEFPWQNKAKRQYDFHSAKSSPIKNHPNESNISDTSNVSRVNETSVLGAELIPGSRFKVKYIFYIFFMLLCYGILKELPYCDGTQRFCVNLPEHCKLKRGKYVCDSGYIYKKSIFRNYCKKDDSKEVKRNRVIQNIIKSLEIRNGDFLYGKAPTAYVKISTLTKDAVIIEELRKRPEVQLEGENISAVSYRISFKTFIYYYIKKILMILVPLLILIGMLMYLLEKRKLKREAGFRSKKVIKDILNVLLRQLIISSRNSRFPEYVYVDQLRDVFGENKYVWEIVEQKISANSNVTTVKVDEKTAWQWIGPIIRRKESLDKMEI